ncbi:MAG: hypothetical protein QOG63_369 [Thermoleophilaceae bacterium]|nr:hypothetical protein [Thermoleophilaceae bacterium]
MAVFGFVQFELAMPLGPADGRYLRRTGGGGEPERVIVLRTLGAPERRRFGGRRPKAVEGGGEEPVPVPTVRATLIGAEPLSDPAAWLDSLRGDSDAREAEVDDALRELNAILRAHRAAAADPYARELARWQANAIRIGYGSGDQVADGRFDQAYEVPEPRGRMRRAETLAPQERLAAILGGTDHALVAEELVLRARLDLDAGRPREAALQARVALEALLAEVPWGAAEVAEHRDAVAQAANAALEGDPPAELVTAVEEAVRAMHRALAAATRRRQGE